MGERLLIVTADDFGIGEAVDRGIRDAIRVGTVTAVSLLANGQSIRPPDLELARVDAGVHVNLTQGKPLSSPSSVSSLVRPDGTFHPLFALLLRATFGLIRSEHVRREVEAQIDRLTLLGWRLSHADSHQHVHVHPALAGPMAQVVRSAGIGRMRCPFDLSRGPSRAKALGIASATRVSHSCLGKLAWPTTTRGIARRPVSLAELSAILESLPTGPAEMIVHLCARQPADPGDQRLPDPAERHSEWATLTDPLARSVLARHGVRIIVATDSRRGPAGACCREVRPG